MRKRTKGFTLVELLVVIGIIALLMGILMPALNRVRLYAHRMLEGTNLSAVGKAMMIYSNDYDEVYPRAGGKDSWWAASGGPIFDWDADTEKGAFNYDLPDTTGAATIGASFYLLIKYAEMMPKIFLCKSDIGTTEFKLSDWVDQSNMIELEQAWDFYETPGRYYSFSYHLPYRDEDKQYKAYPLSSVNRPDSPLCATRNPWLDENAREYLEDTTIPDPTCSLADGFDDPYKKWNAAPHKREGQNVLFNDSHVRFETSPACGIENDNIYRHREIRDETQPQTWTRCEKELSEGGAPGGNDAHVGRDNAGVQGHYPACYEDAFLVNEHQDYD